jgi:hypothetical protein
VAVATREPRVAVLAGQQATAESEAPEARDYPSGADRREHTRHTLADIPFVTRVRLKYGPVVSLIDLSVGGAQIETTAYRLQPGSSVVVEFEGEGREIVIPATVLRCQLASLLPEPVYRGALAFKNNLDLGALGAVPTSPAPVQELDPALEQARLRETLARLSVGSEAPGRQQPGDEGDVLNGALGAAVAVLDTRAGRRSGPVLASELAGLLKATTNALNRQTKPGALIAAIEEHVRRVIPARAVRVDETGSFLPLPASEAILFPIPSLDPSMPATSVGKVVVEFSQGCEPLEWHMQLLKSAIHLISLVRELDRRAGDAPPVPTPAERLPSGWSRIVAHYRGGQTIKGFTQHFLAVSGSLNVSPAPDASASARVTVPFKTLKAIFFVRDHEGSPGYQEKKTLDSPPRGRKISVTFTDGEELVGTTVNYLRSAPGFFVHPADPKSNNERVFVVAQAVRDVKFL